MTSTEEENLRITLENYLKNNVLEITFHKKDGSLRTIRASLKPQYIRDKVVGTGEQVNNRLLAFIDIDEDKWKSCYLSKITAIELVKD